MVGKYTVTWTIDLEAESVEDAVRQVWGIFQDPDSTATFFRVQQPDGTEVFQDFFDVVQTDGEEE